MTKQRIAYLDFIKGVCIILLVSFHVKPQGHELHQTFLMPIFFFLSGLNFKTYDGFNTFLRRKVNTLLVPLVFFVLLGTLYCFCRNLLEVHFNAGEAISKLPINPIVNNTPMWFLFVLFVVNIIYYLFVKHLPHWLVIVSSLLLGGIGFYIAKQGYVLEPYLDIAFVAMPFYMLGNEIGKRGGISYQPPLAATLALTAATIIWVYVNTPVINMLHRNYPNALLLFGMTTLVILSLFFVCKYVKRPVPIISYLGRYSLIVLGTHYFLIGILRMIGKKIFGSDETLIWLSVLIVTMALEIPVIYLLIKYCPRFTAKKEFFNKGWKINKPKEIKN